MIIEDEELLAEQLETMIQEIAKEYKVVATAHSIASGIHTLRNNQVVDLIFSDIYLADGLSFEIFKQERTETPIIFTTGYNQYAIKAFEHNSLDYLLKPLKPEKLEQSLSKFERLRALGTTPSFKEQFPTIKEVIYRSNFLLSQGDRLVPIHVDDIQYFTVTHGVVKAFTKKDQMFLMEETLEELSEQLDPKLFFRANRQYLIHRNSIRHIERYFNGRLLINLFPKSLSGIVVSRRRAQLLKAWMNI
ncbi:MAG: LytTR family DNA-binding domain-containing protein [Cytophagales bacterium]|nr:LytTR family DNA-binding domain-containing protein [Cytophagales bacterium]